MTISSTNNRWSYTGNGSTTSFAYDNRIFADTDLKVYLDGALQTSGYSVTPVGASGNVVFSSAPASAVVVEIVRSVANTQTADYVAFDKFPAETHEAALDRRTIVDQQQQDQLDRAVKLPDGEASGATVEIPAKASRASKFWAWDALGNLYAATPAAVDVALSTIGNALATAASAAAALSSLGLSAFSLLGTAATNLRIYEVNDASATYEDYDGAGGTTLTDYDVTWMDGFYIAWNLRWNATAGMHELIDNTKRGMFFHITYNNFPFETFRAIWFGRVQTTAERTAATNNHKPGIDAEVIWPAAGSVGGMEIIVMFGENGTVVFGGAGPEYDGFGSVPFARSMHQKVGGKHYSGMIVNAFPDLSGTDRANKPSYFTGFLWDEDGTGNREWVQLYEAAQDAGAGATVQGTSAVVWTTQASWPANTGPTGTSLVQSPMANATATQAHGLLVAPTRFDVYATCLTAEHGYSIGDVVPLSVHQQDASGACCWAITADATNTTLLKNGGQPNFANKSTRANANMTLANWSLTVVPRVS